MEGLHSTSETCHSVYIMLPAVSLFTIDQALLLSGFLASPQRPAKTFGYPQLAGFVFGLANGPELIQPSEWIPLVFNDQEARYETGDEAERVTQAMMALYNDCLRVRPRGMGSLPPGCEIQPILIENLKTTAPLSQWAQGFGVAYDYLSEVWEAYLPDELDEELGALLMTLTFFSSPELAAAYHKETKKNRSFEQFSQSILEVFSDAMGAFAHLGRSIYQARLEAGEFNREPVPVMKVGRNDLCPCGSGKKYKKCCDLTAGTVGGPTFH